MAEWTRLPSGDVAMWRGSQRANRTTATTYLAWRTL